MFNGYHRRRSFKGQHALEGILSFNVLLYCTDRLLFVGGKRKEGWVCCESDTIKVGRSVLSPTVFQAPFYRQHGTHLDAGENTSLNSSSFCFLFFSQDFIQNVASLTLHFALLF